MSKFRTLLKVISNKGLNAAIRLIVARWFPEHIKPIENINLYLPYFKNKNGIEIGGPSRLLSAEIPIYQVVNSLDGCNFSNQTVWEGNIAGGDYYYHKNKKGVQYICEASNLQIIPDEKYEFIVAVHCLEHCANTLKTMEEWLRILEKGGAIMLILPDRRYTFDHNRPLTTFNHLVDDYKRNIDETDLTHLSEILKLHDLKLDKKAGSKVDFKERSMANYENRCLHHHVFDFKLLKEIFNYFNIKIIDMTFERPYHQIILGVKQ